MIWRFFQTFGVSSGLAVGGGVIGDIYKLEERGTAMGIFFAVGSPHLVGEPTPNSESPDWELEGGISWACAGTTSRRSVNSVWVIELTNPFHF